MVMRLRREAILARGFVFPGSVDRLSNLVDGEGAFLYLPPLGVVEDLGEALNFVLGVCV